LIIALDIFKLFLWEEFEDIQSGNQGSHRVWCDCIWEEIEDIQSGNQGSHTVCCDCIQQTVWEPWLLLWISSNSSHIESQQTVCEPWLPLWISSN
jgi:hypothetical protein